MLTAFSGLGGLDLGLEAAGFESIGFIEFSKICRDSVALNKPKWIPAPWNDIHEAAEECSLSKLQLEKGDLDLLAGAPPCQPFSKASQWSNKGRQGFNDKRADTLASFLHLIEALEPKMVLMENVPEFWSDNIGAKEIIHDFFDNLNETKKLNYTYEARVLDSSHYGVPQRRKRLIFIASRVGSYRWPIARYKDKPMTSWDAIGHLKSSIIPALGGKWADLLPSIPEGANYLWHTSRGGGGELFGYRTRFWSFLLKLAKDKPSWTIAAQPGPSTGPFHWDNRPLSIEELLALQTLPPSWSVSGNRREQIMQIGNATPALLAEILGRQLIKSGLNKDVPKSLKCGLKRSKVISSPTKCKPLHTKYSSLIKRKADHPGAGLGPKGHKFSTL